MLSGAFSPYCSRSHSKMSWRNHHDVEAGIPSPGCYPKRFLARRARWIFGVAIAAGVVLYISDYRYAPLRPPRLSGEWKSDGEVGELEDIWEDEGGVETAEPKGWGWGLGLPFGKPAPPPSAEEDDEDAFVPVDDYIAPMHPDLSLLPAPSKLFAEVHLPDFLKPPEDDFFPNERLREIISDPPPEVGTTPVEGWVIPDDAFSKNWVGPEMWDQPKGDVRRVQWEGFARGRDGWETAEQKMVREERREAVRRGFVWAWQAYKTYAWGGQLRWTKVLTAAYGCDQDMTR